MLSNNLAYKILSQKYKTLFIKIDLLDWSEEKIGEIGGMAQVPYRFKAIVLLDELALLLWKFKTI